MLAVAVVAVSPEGADKKYKTDLSLKLLTGVE